MKCPNCGKSMPNDKKFCGFCGKPLLVKKAEQTIQPQSIDKKSAKEVIPIVEDVAKKNVAIKKRRFPFWLPLVMIAVIIAVVLIISQNRQPKPIYEADFNGSADGFNLISISEKKSYLGTDGKLYLEYSAPDSYTFLKIPVNSNNPNKTIETEITFIKGAEISEAGVFCRYRDPGNFIQLTIQKNGEEIEIRTKDPNWVTLASKKVSQFDFNKPINFRGECIGDSYKIFINDAEIVSYKGPLSLSGENSAALFVSNGVGTEIVSFDNLKVYESNR